MVEKVDEAEHLVTIKRHIGDKDKTILFDYSEFTIYAVEIE
jgi:hypothetical protein